jgi:hypothetical protein
MLKNLFSKATLYYQDVTFIKIFMFFSSIFNPLKTKHICFI